jgi:uncharacterized membrane protein
MLDCNSTALAETEGQEAKLMRVARALSIPQGRHSPAVYLSCQYRFVSIVILTILSKNIPHPSLRTTVTIKSPSDNASLCSLGVLQ